MSAHEKEKNTLIDLDFPEFLVFMAKKLDQFDFASLRVASWAACNLIEGTHSSKFHKIKCLLPLLKTFITIEDSEVAQDCLYALLAFLQTNSEEFEVFQDSYFSILKRVCRLMLATEPAINFPALKIVSELLKTSSEEVRDQLIESGCIKGFSFFLSKADKQTLRETCFALSNLIASPKSQETINLLSNSRFSVYEKLAQILVNGSISVNHNLLPSIILLLAG